MHTNNRTHNVETMITNPSDPFTTYGNRPQKLKMGAQNETRSTKTRYLPHRQSHAKNEGEERGRIEWHYKYYRNAGRITSLSPTNG